MATLLDGDPAPQKRDTAAPLFLARLLWRSGRPYQLLLSTCFQTNQQQNTTRMWANAQRNGRPAEYRWRPLFNAAKFG